MRRDSSVLILSIMTILMIVKSNEVREVSSGKLFREGMKDEVPMVWRGGGFRIVPSASTWNEEEIWRRMKKRIENADVRMKDRYFTYYDENMLLSNFVTRDDAYERRETSREFFRLHTTKRNVSHPFVRYGGPLNKFSTDLFEKDEPYNIENIFDSKPSLSLFWGGPGVVSTSHFDYHRNIYVLLFGEKDFLFAHPDDWSRFKPFPMLHPHARQGQLHFDSDASLTPRNRVQLKRGDVLYIPPGWIHHVRSGESGMHIALSACILTDTHRRMNEWFAQNRKSVAPIPFLKNDWKWNFDNVLGVLKIFFRHLQNSSLNTSSYEELLYERFSPQVRHSLGIPNKYDPGRAFPCPGNLPFDLESATTEASKKIVELYENISTSWEQREFLKPFLEGILFRLGGKMLLGLDFIEACILGGDDESYRHGGMEL